MARKSNKSALKLDWATYEAAKYACEHWHYSGCMPVGKLVKIGIWEDDKFIGVVLFGRGATYRLLQTYGLEQNGGCELVRIALTAHKAPVSRIMSIALRFLKRSNPELQMIVSFADPNQNHHGGIYQATNWIYAGYSIPGGSLEYFYKGRWRHARSMREIWGNVGKEMAQKHNVDCRKPSRKHRYLYPLNKQMRKQILPLAKPYPKRVQSIDADALPNHGREGGSIPTCTLQNQQGVSHG